MTKSTIDQAVLDALEVGAHVLDKSTPLRSERLLSSERQILESVKAGRGPSIPLEHSMARSMDRDAAPEENLEIPDTAESRRVAEGVNRVLEGVFGAKAFADVVDDQGAPNLLAIKRVERAVTASADLSESQRKFLLDGVRDLEAAYRERFAAERARHQQELAAAQRRAVHDRIHVPLAVAVFCVAGSQRDEAKQLQKHCEDAAKRGVNFGDVAEAAVAFRDAWQEIWGSEAANTSMDAQEALQILGGSVPDTADARIINALRGLRGLSGLYNEPVSPRLLAQGRSALQDEADRVLRAQKLAQKRATRR